MMRTRREISGVIPTMGKAYHNGNDVSIAWKTAGFIPDCRGFALIRRQNGVEGTESTWVGFEDGLYAEGERRASTHWPIQQSQWTDHMANPGDRLQNRALPIGGPVGVAAARGLGRGSVEKMGE